MTVSQVEELRQPVTEVIRSLLAGILGGGWLTMWRKVLCLGIWRSAEHR